MGSLMRQQQQIEKRKRIWFLGAEAVGLGLVLLGSKFLGLIAIGVGAWLGWDWFKYRAKNGMRF